MNENKVNKVVNQSLKLYRKSYIGHIAIVSAVAAGTLILTNFAINMVTTITSITAKFAVIIELEFFDTALITGTLFTTKPKYNKYKINKLKKLKQELDSGYNRFENVPQSELGYEIIKYLNKRKVK